MITKKIIPVLCAVAVGLGSCTSTKQAGQEEAAVVPAIDFSAMDTTIRAQDDFYHHVNGSWIKNNPLKPAYSRYGTFDILRDSSTTYVHRIVEELAAAQPKAGSNEYRIATIYRQAMDSLVPMS